MRKYLSIVLLIALLVVPTELFASGTKEAGGESQATFRMMSHRHPALEYYAEELDSALPNVSVESTLQPYDTTAQQTRVYLSSGEASPFEIYWTTDSLLAEYAENGWIRPIDEYIEKYNDEYNFLDDIPASAWEGVTYEGKRYGIPILNNIMLFFYREDIFEKYDLDPPETFDQFLGYARMIDENEPDMKGTTLTFKRVDALTNAFHSYLSGFGGSWFDEDGQPAFNSREGIQAVNLMQELMNYAPSGVLSFANDQSTVAFQQGQVAMGIQWYTRAASMDNEEVSTVVGKMQFAVPPSSQGASVPATRVSVDSYVIPSQLAEGVDPELVFRTIAEATDEESMLGVTEHALVPRTSVRGDPEVSARYRYWPVASDTIEAGAKSLPMNGAFSSIAEEVTLRISQALAGELGVEEALNMAAERAREILAE